jgi:hypothetical protein
MAASNASDIPDGMIKGKYCKCNNCKISREEGREEIRYLVNTILSEWSQDISSTTEESYYDRILKVLEGR